MILEQIEFRTILRNITAIEDFFINNNFFRCFPVVHIFEVSHKLKTSCSYKINVNILNKNSNSIQQCDTKNSLLVQLMFFFAKI